jgi:hypothetical protein
LDPNGTIFRVRRRHCPSIERPRVPTTLNTRWIRGTSVLGRNLITADRGGCLRLLLPSALPLARAPFVEALLDD